MCWLQPCNGRAGPWQLPSMEPTGAHQRCAAHLASKGRVVPFLLHRSNVIVACLWMQCVDELRTCVWRVCACTHVCAASVCSANGQSCAYVQPCTQAHLPLQDNGRRGALHREQRHHAAVHVLVQVAVEQPGARVVGIHVQHLKGAGLDGNLGGRGKRHEGRGWTWAGFGGRSLIAHENTLMHACLSCSLAHCVRCAWSHSHLVCVVAARVVEHDAVPVGGVDGVLGAQ